MKTPPSLRGHRFYEGRTFGSEAEFNPLTEVLNEGFDVLSTYGQDRHIFSRPLGEDAENVLNSVVHADRTYADYGWRHVVRNEFLPLALKRAPGAGAWLPNYQSHLFGSGMISARMTEWYAQHGVPHPLLFSGVTMMTAHLLNEAVENDGRRAWNEDATTDLLVFDLGGIALWNNDWMQRTFSGRVRLTNWASQPSYNPVTRTMENTGQYFSLRAPMPGATSWRIAYVFGMSGGVGLAREFSDGNTLSMVGGVEAVQNPITDARTGAKGATLKPETGIYYDRDGSLLWSLKIGSPSGAVSWITMNAYPGLFRVGSVAPGLWLQLPKDGGVRFGVVSRWGVGVGAGSAR